jgi:hypothetical protein
MYLFFLFDFSLIIAKVDEIICASAKKLGKTKVETHKEAQTN